VSPRPSGHLAASPEGGGGRGGGGKGEGDGVTFSPGGHSLAGASVHSVALAGARGC